ncbi:MAG: aminotransferase class V-fold PLP-dependent enzyme [Gammaproteobacteria bacterium]|nr:aminotransferase class V-fold PLP-dependent enzyme [Gammaproteobacteria bacterium]
MTNSADLSRHDARRLARHYSRFRVGDRILLTGHSHQAWPDVAFDAQMQAWHDAAEQVDGKWDVAAAIADEVREGYRRLLDDPDGHIALGQNTHELVTRFLSALPLRDRPRVVTTDGEFHTVRRQLARLQEEGLEVVQAGATGSVPAPGAIAQAVIDALDDRTAAVVMSSVLFRNGLIVEGLDEVAKACEHVGACLLVDAYHSINVVPFSVFRMGLERAFVVGGGYKYCQFGEGVCFLRIPGDCSLRPILTGWFSEFGELADNPAAGPVAYGHGPHRFAGSTYDPVGHYRARAVLRFFQAERLNPPLLRAISRAQLARLTEGIDALDLDPAVLSWNRDLPLERRGGFLALDAPDAGELAARLRSRHVFCDHRGTVLRLGPAPYVTNAQLDEAVDLLGEAVGQP